MINLFSFFRKKKNIWKFSGGIYPPEMKIQSSCTPLHHIVQPKRFIIPLKQHLGKEGELQVKKGDKVLRGQQLTLGCNRMLPIHAPTSGKIVAIAPHSIAHPSALSELCVIIDADGEDRWIKRNKWKNYFDYSRKDLINRIDQYGIAGLGGAGFPTSIKLHNGENKIKTLIINAAECEPYITADDCLIKNCAMQIIEGICIIAYILQAKEILIGIEDNKSQAISALNSVLTKNSNIKLIVIPTKYPSGAARQLIKILTGKKIPRNKHSLEYGILMQNISTVYAVKRAIIDGEPFTERVITVTGKAIKQPRNIWVRLGTTVRHVLEQVGYSPNINQTVIVGGPMMGFIIPWIDVPVVKIMNCLLLPSEDELDIFKEEKNCIRCGICADVCPENLLPQQLYWFSRGNQHDKVESYNINDCIECGACAWVCPSNIPLVQYFRQEKAKIHSLFLDKQRSLTAKARFEARQRRLKRIKNNIF